MTQHTAGQQDRAVCLCGHLIQHYAMWWPVLVLWLFDLAFVTSLTLDWLTAESCHSLLWPLCGMNSMMLFHWLRTKGWWLWTAPKTMACWPHSACVHYWAGERMSSWWESVAVHILMSTLRVLLEPSPGEGTAQPCQECALTCHRIYWATEHLDVWRKLVGTL